MELGGENVQVLVQVLRDSSLWLVVLRQGALKDHFLKTGHMSSAMIHWVTRCFKYDRDCLHLFTHKLVPVIFEPPCTFIAKFCIQKALHKFIVSFQASPTKYTRSTLFYDITQHMEVIPRRRLGTTYSYNLQELKIPGSRFWILDTLRLDQIGCQESSLRNCHYTLRNAPEECRSQI